MAPATGETLTPATAARLQGPPSRGRLGGSRLPDSFRSSLQEKNACRPFQKRKAGIFLSACERIALRSESHRGPQNVSAQKRAHHANHSPSGDFPPAFYWRSIFHYRERSANLGDCAERSGAGFG